MWIQQRPWLRPVRDTVEERRLSLFALFRRAGAHRDDAGDDHHQEKCSGNKEIMHGEELFSVGRLLLAPPD